MGPIGHRGGFRLERGRRCCLVFAIPTRWARVARVERSGCCSRGKPVSVGVDPLERLGARGFYAISWKIRGLGTDNGLNWRNSC